MAGALKALRTRRAGESRDGRGERGGGGGPLFAQPCGHVLGRPADSRQSRTYVQSVACTTLKWVAEVYNSYSVAAQHIEHQAHRALTLASSVENVARAMNSGFDAHCRHLGIEKLHFCTISLQASLQDTRQQYSLCRQRPASQHNSIVKDANNIRRWWRALDTILYCENRFSLILSPQAPCPVTLGLRYFLELLLLLLLLLLRLRGHLPRSGLYFPSHQLPGFVLLHYVFFLVLGFTILIWKFAYLQIPYLQTHMRKEVIRILHCLFQCASNDLWNSTSGKCNVWNTSAVGMKFWRECATSRLPPRRTELDSRRSHFRMWESYRKMLLIGGLLHTHLASSSSALMTSMMHFVWCWPTHSTETIGHGGIQTLGVLLSKILLQLTLQIRRICRPMCGHKHSRDRREVQGPCWPRKHIDTTKAGQRKRVLCGAGYCPPDLKPILHCARFQRTVFTCDSAKAWKCCSRIRPVDVSTHNSQQQRPNKEFDIPYSPKNSFGKTEVSKAECRNEGGGGIGDPRENPPTSGIVRHDSHVRKSGREGNWGHCGVAVRHSSTTKANRVRFQAGSPGISHVLIVSVDAAGRRLFTGISRFLRPCIPILPHTHLASPSSALKTSLLRIAQTCLLLLLLLPLLLLLLLLPLLQGSEHVCPRGVEATMGHIRAVHNGSWWLSCTPIRVDSQEK
ncbi:hypothetical protein PR048_000380 [Dryococelus australis]|uniref:Uncharacterized protein n=1 Tax=Dryococelus australis TaxID=614101 RepID=A0ABQ9IEG3_9NEOP|nr:hypothetical protein PR048_000380 [Dryococelus australis]